MSINIDDLTYGQIKELAALMKPSGLPNAVADNNGSNCRLANDGDPAIVVLQRGHVAVGIYEQDGHIGILSKAAIVRYWGTTEGLGELAQKGPLEKTKLDKCPPLTFHIRESIFKMGVSDAWRDYFANY